MSGTAARLLALLTVLTVLATGCRSAPPAGHGTGQPSGSSRSSPSDPASSRPQPPVTAAPTSSDYAEAIRTANKHGLQVWLESDLVKRWQQGAGSFQAALRQLGSLAMLPGVRGIKIADELGYHDGLNSTARVSDFLGAAAAGLGSYAPGKPLLIDMIVPVLGCLPDQDPPLLWATECRVKTDGQYPQLSLASISHYLSLRDVSVLDLSTGLLPDSTYAGWGVTRDIAQDKAWAKVRQLGWPSLVTVHARKALAHPGSYPGSSGQAAADLHTWVDIPLAGGARAVDVWTWRQLYQGEVNRLLDPGLQPNALWQGLLQRRAAGDQLFTHFSPHSVEVGLDADLAMMATVFSSVFIAAGTG